MPAPFLDPELAAGLDAMPASARPRALIDFDDLPGMRERLRHLVGHLLSRGAPTDGIAVDDRHVPGPADGAPVRVRVYRPVDGQRPLPCLYWIHGGGMVSGSIEAHDGMVRSFVAAVGCAAVSVDYRLPPEHPHPAPVEDCYAGLCWTAAEADALGVDRGRLAIGGASAGGGLAAATALLARDRQGPALVLQLLAEPMLDDRSATPSSHEVTDLGIWDRDMNERGWAALLGEAVGTDAVSGYAAPARMLDLAGLPPAFLDVGTAEVFRDETIAYASRLLACGVPTELHVYPGAYHGWETIAPAAALSVAAVRCRNEALARAFRA